MLPHNPELTALIDKLWNRFWSGGISNPLSAIEQITYLLFMKRLDELDRKREQEARANGRTFESYFRGHCVLPQYRAQADALSTAKSRETAVEKKTRQAELRRLQINKSTLRWSSFNEKEADEMLSHV